MKTRFLLVVTVILLAFTGSSQAGRGWGGCGWGGGGGWHGGWGGGYCGPRFGWGGGWGGWCGPAFGVTFAAPLPVYRPVYYVQPAPSYVIYRTAAPSSTLARAQAQLANLGYYRGSVDGAFGPLTSRAITLYQSDNGLPVTGRLDRVTLRSLGS